MKYIKKNKMISLMLNETLIIFLVLKKDIIVEISTSESLDKDTFKCTL